MEIKYTKKALQDRDFWKKSGRKSVQNKISKLIDSIELTPYEGIGKPEPLKHELSGLWSRRIDKKHRIIYRYFEDKNLIEIYSLKGHYD